MSEYRIPSRLFDETCTHTYTKQIFNHYIIYNTLSSIFQMLWNYPLMDKMREYFTI